MDRFRQSRRDDPIVAYLKALKIIVGAKGEIADSELEAFISVTSRMGVSDVVRREMEDFDHSSTTLEEVLPFMTPGGRVARMLLRDAVHIARADGTYAAEERAAVKQTADFLQIDAGILREIEQLAEYEEMVEKLNRSIFGSGV